MLFSCKESAWSHASLFLQSQLATPLQFSLLNCPPADLDECGILEFVNPKSAACKSPQDALAQLAVFLNVNVAERPLVHPEKLWIPTLADVTLAYAAAIALMLYSIKALQAS